MLAQEKGIIHMADALPELPAGRVEELCRQDQTHHRTARGRSSPNHAAHRDLGTTAEEVTCKAVCQMPLYMFVHSTAILLLSRANENYLVSGIWDHISTGTDRFVFG